MNRCGYQQKSSEERSMMMVDTMSMVCPKPRRLGILNPSLNDQLRPLRLPMPINYQGEMGDSKAGADLLDIILTKGGCVGYQVASSPPFYCGSPPSRASNPVIQDAQFGNEKITHFSPGPLSPSSRKGGGCVPMTYGHKPAAVRVEGFDCLGRDRQNCSIPAVA
ncbi:uncharacterized protein LOC126653440 [Mercurialis annua]|uniref:uncharacterized protein LOC126653440 n=1 Tax=Mercurialis annua TaxID=3986 RepID=UPI00215E7D7E|nr:uncharacterized protein LOC126653440 [Mercurialis annua]